MKSVSVLLSAVVAILVVGCQSGPPKSLEEKRAESREGKVPDNVRDPRPEMPPMGPLFVPQR